MTSPRDDDATDAQVEATRSGIARQTVEFLVVLCLSILLFRTFAAEAYIVPTGSMAPTLLGNHKEVACSNCHLRFALGLDEEGRGGRPVCPNCGQDDLDKVPAVECNGDRLLVQKLIFDLRRPGRWEVAVFHFPGDPSQVYVKRVVGLPGEAIQILGGDILVNDRIARKSLREQRAMRLPVFDNRFVPRDADRYPRWTFRRGGTRRLLDSGWHAEGTRFVHEPVEPGSGPLDWLEYRHWDSDRGRYAPVHDFNAYNGADLRGEHVVADLMVEARIVAKADVGALDLRIKSGADRFVVSLPVGKGQEIEVRRNGRRLSISNPRRDLAESGLARGSLLEASVMDRRLSVAVDGQLVFDPVDYDDPAVGPDSDESPVAFGVRKGSLTISDLRLFRDVYYTGVLANSPRRPFGVESAYLLGPDEFFVLGDNSPVSNDSRFWERSPVVPGDLFVGKPFLVHLPGQVVPFRVFGRSIYWVPDPREIRYIR